MVRRERAREIVSFASEWSRQGRPVMVQRVKPQEIQIFSKFTVIIDSGSRASGFVPLDIKEKLQPDSNVYFFDTDTLWGMISDIGKERDLHTGMFPVRVQLDAPIFSERTMAVVSAHIQTFPDVLAVASEALDMINNAYYLWVIDDQKAKRVLVEVGAENDQQTIITRGVASGDLVVVRGHAHLSEGENVIMVQKD